MSDYMVVDSMHSLSVAAGRSLTLAGVYNELPFTGSPDYAHKRIDKLVLDRSIGRLWIAE
jgi:hypothetical protein